MFFQPGDREWMESSEREMSARTMRYLYSNSRKDGYREALKMIDAAYDVEQAARGLVEVAKAWAQLQAERDHSTWLLLVMAVDVYSHIMGYDSKYPVWHSGAWYLGSAYLGRTFEEAYQNVSDSIEIAWGLAKRRQGQQVAKALVEVMKAITAIFSPDGGDHLVTYSPFHQPEIAMGWALTSLTGFNKRTKVQVVLFHRAFSPSPFSVQTWRDGRLWREHGFDTPEEAAKCAWAAIGVGTWEGPDAYGCTQLHPVIRGAF